MGKNRERVRSCFSPRLKPPRQTRGRPQFIAAERITPRAATAFKIYYAVKSHLAAARRCGASRRHAGGPRLSRPYPRRTRSEAKSRGVMREGRACRGRTHAASRSEVKSRGVMREGRACRGRTHAGPVRTPYAEPPPPLCLRFLCVIKSRLLPEPPSPKASSPRQSDIVGRKGHNVRKAFAASAAPLPAFIGVGREIGINRPENRNKGVPLEGDAPIKLIELNYGILKSHESFKAHLLFDGGRGAGRVGGCGARCSPLRTRHAGTSGNPKARRRNVPPVQKLQHTTRHRVKDRSGDGRLRAVDGH